MENKMKEYKLEEGAIYLAKDVRGTSNDVYELSIAETSPNGKLIKFYRQERGQLGVIGEWMEVDRFNISYRILDRIK
jgi:hypothetical protein